MSFIQRVLISLRKPMTKVSKEALKKQTHQAKERLAQPVKSFYENNVREQSQKLVDHGKKLPSEVGVMFNTHITKPTKKAFKDNISDPAKKTFKSGTRKAAKAVMICSFLGGAGYAAVHSIRILLTG